MAITPLTSPGPSPVLYPATFETDTELFHREIITTVSEMNTAIEALNLNDTTATSATSLSATVASKTLTVVETGKGFVIGMDVKVSYTTDATTWMHGTVTAWNSGTKELIISVDMIGVGVSGAGPFTAWSICMSPPVDNSGLLVPWIINLDPFMTPGSATYWSTISVNAACIYGGILATTGAAGAEITWPVILAAGTWKISLMHTKDSVVGHYHFLIDGVDVGTDIDGYNATPVYNVVSTIADIAVAASGKKTFKISLEQIPAAKLYGYIQNIQLIRTA